jgi:hypothetical protein
MFLHEAWIDITKEKPPNLNFVSFDKEHLEVLILTKRGEICLVTPCYLDEDGTYVIEGVSGELQLSLNNGFYEDVENVTHWMLLDNLYKKGKA